VSRPIPTVKFLEEWQDGLIEMARARLRAKGEIVPIVWMLTYAELVPEDLRAQCQPLGKGSLWSDAERFAVLVLPISHNAREVSEMLYALGDEEARAMLDTLKQLSKTVPGMTPTKFRELVVKAACEAQGWDVKDVVAAYIRHMLERSGAVAYVKNMDGWTAHTQESPGTSAQDARAKLAPSLEDEPAASEAVISLLEHAEGVRMVLHPYQRRQRNTGKVKSWGDRRVTFTPRGSDDLSGRFMWMLPVPEHPPAGEGVH